MNTDRIAGRLASQFGHVHFEGSDEFISGQVVVVSLSLLGVVLPSVMRVYEVLKKLWLITVVISRQNPPGETQTYSNI